jgi:O-glycosyl hydrolase
MRSHSAGWVVAVVFVLAGCGGGGSGSNNTTPPPPTPPTVTSVTPANMSTGVAVNNATVTATFSVAMNSSTISASSFTLTSQNGAVAGSVSYNAANSTATFTPTNALAYSTTYTATITTAAQNTSGTALASNYTWSFTTASAPAPMVTAITPANASNGVLITAAITATFNEAMNSSTITGSTFTLTPQGGSAVPSSVTYDSTSMTATLTPTSPLNYNTTYTATITTGVAASNGSALASNYTWTFTTTTPPPLSVTGVSPAIDATGVSVGTTVTATFNAALNATTITGSTFVLTGPNNTPVAGSVTAGTTTATFIPTGSLAYNTTYTATITTGVQSSAGAALTSNYSWTFITTTAPVPTVAATVPAAGATNVNVGNALTATFSLAMDSSTITASTFTLATTSGNTPVAGAVSYNAATSIATFMPNSALTYNTSYTATITTGAKSSNEAPLASNYVWTFTTSAAANQVTVDFGTTYQTIRGFGGSTAWLGQMPQAVATALFSTTNGLGLSILRVRIDPEGSASGGGAHNDPYETQQWDWEAANGLEAHNVNPNAIVFASPWTPPAAWKLNGSSNLQDDGQTWNQSFNNCAEGSGYCGGYLDPNHYADYANYLEDFVKFFNTSNGFNLFAISMQNEPEENVTYESCVWTPEEMDAWISGNAATITSDQYHTKLMMPESNNFNPIDAATSLSDPNAEGLISIVGGHIYQILFGGSIVPYSIPSGDTPKELWMTEFGPLSTATPTWTQALTTYAESIHNSLVTGGYNAYVWWGIYGAPTNAGSYGLVDNSGNPTVMGDVVGQYSKFIQPGFVRASATANPISGVYVSAYTNSSPSHYVIVVINANTTSEPLSFVVNNGSVTSVTPYQSTSAGGLIQQIPVNVSGGQFTYTLPAQSIVTFYQ